MLDYFEFTPPEARYTYEDMAEIVSNMACPLCGEKGLLLGRGRNKGDETYWIECTNCRAETDPSSQWDDPLCEVDEWAKTKENREIKQWLNLKKN